MPPPTPLAVVDDDDATASIAHWQLSVDRWASFADGTFGDACFQRLRVVQVDAPHVGRRERLVVVVDAASPSSPSSPAPPTRVERTSMPRVADALPTVTFEIPVDRARCNPLNSVHGAAYAYYVDVLTSVHAHACLGHSTVSVSINTRCQSPAPLGSRMLAVSRIEKAGAKLVHATLHFFTAPTPHGGAPPSPDDDNDAGAPRALAAGEHVMFVTRRGEPRASTATNRSTKARL